jgi:hypothetical protein
MWSSETSVKKVAGLSYKDDLIEVVVIHQEAYLLHLKILPRSKYSGVLRLSNASFVVDSKWIPCDHHHHDVS